MSQDNSNSAKPWGKMYQSFQDKRYFSGLDGLRCLAILAVIWHHCPRLESFPDFLQRGFLGVDIFYILSGFLIVTLILREKDRKGKISLRNFYLRKLLRIVPIYYGLIIALSFLYAIKFSDPSAQAFFKTLPYYLTFTSNWTLAQAPNLDITWALATEVQFYLIWPIFEVFVSPVIRFIVLGLFVLLNQLTSLHVIDGFWTLIYGDGFRDLEILQTTFTPICFGIILAHLLHNRKTFELTARFLSHRWTSTALLILLAGSVIFSPSTINSGGLFRLIFHILMIVFLGALLIRDKTAVHKFLSPQPFVEIGVVSYGIYLYHMFALHFTRAISSTIGLSDLPETLFMFCVGSLVSYLVAKLSFDYYEKPILALKKRFT